MKNNIVYPNDNLGKGGWFYWVIPLLLVFPLIFIFIFIFSILQPDYSNIEKIIFLVGILFFGFYFFKGREVLMVGAKTAKKISIFDDEVEFTTYVGKKYKFKKTSELLDISNKFLKKHQQLLFPLESKIFCVTLGGRKYFLPVKKEYIKQLTGQPS